MNSLCARDLVVIILLNNLGLIVFHLSKIKMQQKQQQKYANIIICCLGRTFHSRGQLNHDQRLYH